MQVLVVGVLSVGVVTATNSIVITNIQGTFNTGVGTIGFNNGSTVLGLDGTTGEVLYVAEMLEVL